MLVQQPKEVSYNIVPKLTAHSIDVYLGVGSNYILPFHVILEENKNIHFFGTRGEIMEKREFLVVMQVPWKISEQSMVQADIVFPRCMCSCGNLLNGVFTLSIDTMTMLTFLWLNLLCESCLKDWYCVMYVVATKTSELQYCSQAHNTFQWCLFRCKIKLYNVISCGMWYWRKMNMSKFILGTSTRWNHE